MKDNNIVLTSRSYIKTLSTLHLMFLFALLAFLAICFFLNNNLVFDYSDISDPFIYIVPIFTLGGYFIGNFLYNSKIKKIDKNETLKHKLSNYQSITIIRFACIDGPALLGIVAFFKTGNLFFVLFAGLLIIYFFTLRPSKVKVISELEMSSEERTIFNKENQEIK